MITELGRVAILRYLAGEQSMWAGSIVVGVGKNDPQSDDDRIEFEIGEAPIDLAISSIVNSAITVKGTLPAGIAGAISEVGITTRIREPGTGSSRLLTSFDSTMEPVTGAILSGAHNRIGTAAAAISVPASGTASISVDNVDMDLSAYESHDDFSLALYQSDVNATSVEVRLETDDANYFAATMILPVGAGYKIIDFTKGAFTAVGSPSWTNISRMVFTGTANAGGDATLHFDGFRINNRDDTEGTLVAREVVPDAEIVDKDASQELDIEITLVLNFGA